MKLKEIIQKMKWDHDRPICLYSLKKAYHNMGHTGLFQNDISHALKDSRNVRVFGSNYPDTAILLSYSYWDSLEPKNSHQSNSNVFKDFVF